MQTTFEEYDSNFDYYLKLREAELQIIYLKDSLYAATVGVIHKHFDVQQQMLAVKCNHSKHCVDIVMGRKNAD